MTKRAAIANSLALVVGLLAAGCTGASGALTAEGWGPLRIGDPGAKVLEAFEVTEAPPDDPEWFACHEVMSRVHPGLVAMVQEGRLTRLSLRGQTPFGVDNRLKVGASEAEVRRAYGDKLVVEPHAYNGGEAKYLTAWTDPGHRGVRFETDAQGRVEAIHAGDATIQLIEGCS